MDVGKRIKALREVKGITVNRLANIAGISQSFLRDIELGNKNPTVETLSYFCEALNITLSEFFNDSDHEISPFLRSAIKSLNDNQQIKLADFINSLTAINEQT